MYPLLHPSIHPSIIMYPLFHPSIHSSSLCRHFFIHPSIHHHYVPTSSSIHFSSIHHHHLGPSFHHPGPGRSSQAWMPGLVIMYPLIHPSIFIHPSSSCPARSGGTPGVKIKASPVGLNPGPVSLNLGPVTGQAAKIGARPRHRAQATETGPVTNVHPGLCVRPSKLGGPRHTAQAAETGPITDVHPGLRVRPSKLGQNP
jgi:hypothetical protein